MNASPDGANKGAFKMDAEHFCAGVPRLMLKRNVARDSLGALANHVRIGRDGGGDKRSSAVGGDSLGNGFQCFVGAFHHVVAASTVNMYVKESRRGDLVASEQLPCA